MKKIFILSIIAILFCAHVRSQIPTPGVPQQKPILITGATVHCGNGTTIANGAVAFDNGKITFVGNSSSAPTDKSKYDVVDATGKHVYPGFILTTSTLGLVEIESFQATIDNTETGSLNPNVKSQIAYNTDSELIPTYRFNGILLAEIAPRGGTISGTSSVMQLDGWNWEDATHTKDVAIHLNWPVKKIGRYNREAGGIRLESNPEYEKTISNLESFFNEAKAYGSLTKKPANLKLEAMQGLFSGKQVLIIHASSAKEIVESVNFAKQFGVQRIAVYGKSETLSVATFLKENSVSVIIPAVHDLPDQSDEDIDLPMTLPARLSKAGLVTAFSHNDMISRGRNLPFYAGTAIAYGMDPEEALKSITLYPARILGIDKVTGSIEVGKDATLFISEGDAFDMRTNIVTDAFIIGKRCILNNKQQALYEQYSKKYGHIK